MDDKKAIEAARALIEMFEKAKNLSFNKEGSKPYTNAEHIEQLERTEQYKALKEALKETLEDKPSRESCIDWVHGFNDCPERDATIEYLEQPTMQWVNYEGKDMPVDDGIQVFVKYKGGEYSIGYSGVIPWNIVAAYMVIE